MPATAEVFKPGVLLGFLFEKWADFRPRLKAEVQGGEAIPHRHQIHPDPPRKQGSSQPQGISPAEELEVFCFVGWFFGEVGVFFPPANPTGDTDRKLNFCCFDFCSFSPCPAETLWTRETKEPLTCLAAPALPFLLEHAGRLQQLRERGPSVFHAFPQSQETVAESDSVLGLGLATNADTALQH